jgi:hypothetical protein
VPIVMIARTRQLAGPAISAVRDAFMQAGSR